ALLLVTFQINQFARRSASPGSLYRYVGQGLGPSWGVITGWSQVIAYVVIGGSVVAGAANYIGVLVHFVVKGYDEPLTVASIILVALAAWCIAYRDIKLSTRVMLVMEFISVALILVLAVGFFIKAGHLIDRAQFSLAGFNPKGIPQGIILAIFSYVGFESATALGHEAKDPLRTIPRAIPLSLITIGAFFVLMSYVLVFAFAGQTPSLDKSNAPLSVLAHIEGLDAFAVLIAIGAIMSFFACAIACINAGARVLFAMSRHGLFYAAAGDAHKTHATPHVAVNISGGVVLLAPLLMYLDHIALLDIYGYLASVGTFGVLFAYVLIAIAAPVYLRKRHESRPLVVLAAIASLVLMAIPLIGSFVPTPAPPYNYLPYVFILVLAVGLVRFAYLRVSRPAVIRAIQDDLIAEAG
ncbi:MAG: APC family permease, partial [Candidatus Eremiobacteraeota bacterium]|nr:APC family permease [Candidatus Eremiobacteraeota bacterium]